MKNKCMEAHILFFFNLMLVQLNFNITEVVDNTQVFELNITTVMSTKREVVFEKRDSIRKSFCLKKTRVSFSNNMLQL